MTSDEDLAGRVRAALAKADDVREVKMFGGVGFMLNGNMVAAASKRGLLVRVGKDRHRDALTRPGTRPMEMRGRVMEGYVYVDPSDPRRRKPAATGFGPPPRSSRPCRRSEQAPVRNGRKEAGNDNSPWAGCSRLSGAELCARLRLASGAVQGALRDARDLSRRYHRAVRASVDDGPGGGLRLRLRADILCGRPQQCCHAACHMRRSAACCHGASPRSRWLPRT